MISLLKLEKLPRSQKFRKIGKILGEAENSLVQGGEVDTPFLLSLLDALGADTVFDGPAREALNECCLLLQNGGEIRRAINTARHILLSETGRFPADWDFIDSDGRLDPSKRRPFLGMLVYLEDIRSPYNVGAMFRTAESFGAEKIFLSPLCADPGHPRSRRSAMGCTELLPWERQIFPADFPVFALETGGIPLDEFPFPRRGIIIAGSEELGVSPRLLTLADASLGRVSIPCYGVKGSLNVSVAFGIVMQAWALSLGKKTEIC